MQHSREWFDFWTNYGETAYRTSPQLRIVGQRVEALIRDSANERNADTRRLKWLEATGVTVSKIESDDGRRWFEVVGPTWFPTWLISASSLRAAIDLAMAREQACSPLHDRADADASG